MAAREASLSTYRLGLMTGKDSSLESLSLESLAQSGYIEYKEAEAGNGTLSPKRDVLGTLELDGLGTLELDGRPGLLQFTGETSRDESADAATRRTRSTLAGDTSVRYAFRGALGEVWRQ